MIENLNNMCDVTHDLQIFSDLTLPWSVTEFNGRPLKHL